MVRHDAKRKNPNPTVGLVTPHQFYKNFLFQFAQNKVPVYHPGYAMVVSDLHRSLGLESRAPHTPLATDATKKRFYQSVCPLRSTPAHCGAELVSAGLSVLVLTPQSPLGGALTELKAGGKFKLQFGRERVAYTVKSVH